eukprot:augustus_masked-scaffold_13-processed-gene-9.0-mRNA-1 protein AED:1.00 eAED:1.00 QI:0/-1/0/0/-1/1/1/0/419
MQICTSLTSVIMKLRVPWRKKRNSSDAHHLVADPTKRTDFYYSSKVLSLGKGQDRVVTPESDHLFEQNQQDLNQPANPPKPEELDWEYYAVFDGHGRSDTAADLCEEELHQVILSKHNAAAPQQEDTLPSDNVITEAFQEMHHKICEAAREERNFRTGTCALIMFVSKAQEENGKIKVKMAWAGDCRGVLFSPTQVNDQILLETVDHKIHTNEQERQRIETQAVGKEPRPNLLKSPMWQRDVEEAEAKGKIIRPVSYVGRRQLIIEGEGGAEEEKVQEVGSYVLFSHTNGISLQVSRSLGDPSAARSAIPDPEIIEIEIDRSEESYRIILASDGLWDMFSTQEVIQALLKKKVKMGNTEKACEKLTKKAKKRRSYRGMRMDDVSVVVIDIPSLLLEPSLDSQTEDPSSVESGSLESKES